jgi:hypothetical protein
VHEDVIARILFDESVTFFRAKPFDCSLKHVHLLKTSKPTTIKQYNTGNWLVKKASQRYLTAIHTTKFVS